MRRGLFAGVLLLLLSLAAAGMTPPRVVASPGIAPLPPPAGWEIARSQDFTQFPWGLDGQAAAAMREFGLVRRQTTRYVAADAGRGERPGSKLDARLSTTAWIFADTHGAYGAKTYLRSLAGAASSPMRPARLALRRQWLLTASGAIPARSWRSWVDAVAGKTAPPLPLLRQQLPRRGLVAHSAGYAEGPASLAAAAPWLPPKAVNFAMEPVIATGRYQWRSRQDAPGTSPGGELVILSYPTPQIAAAQLQPIRAAADLARRSGPLVVAWHGPAAPEARHLVSAVQYEAVVTWNHPLHAKTLAGLILAIFVLIGFILAACVAAGVFTGGMRMLLAKWFPGRFALRPERIIRLKL